MTFTEIIKENNRDNRSKFKKCLSIMINNSFLLYPFCEIYNDNIFIGISILILSLSLYILINIFLAYNISMLEIYTDFKFGYFILNIFISCILYFIITLIKKFLSMKELLLKIIKEREKEDMIKHNIKRYKKKVCIYGIIGIIIHFFNIFLVTSFFRIYKNSILKIILNTFVSIIVPSLLAIIFSCIGFCLKQIGIEKKKILFIIFQNYLIL